MGKLRDIGKRIREELAACRTSIASDPEPELDDDPIVNVVPPPVHVNPFALVLLFDGRVTSTCPPVRPRPGERMVYIGIPVREPIESAL